MGQSGQISIFKSRLAVIGIVLISLAIIGVIVSVIQIATHTFSPDDLIAKMDEEVRSAIEESGVPIRLVRKAASKQHLKDSTITDFERGKLTPKQAAGLLLAETEAAKIQKLMQRGIDQYQVNWKFLLDICLMVIVVAGVLIFKGYRDLKRLA